jgi:GntR family transcriptional regulator
VLFHLNPSSGLPIHLQIQTQVKNAVAAGALRRGEPLPSVRKLAAELGINPNTVVRAYQELERDGIIGTVPGGGTYVAGEVPRLLKAEKLRRVQPYARQLAVEGVQLGLTDQDIVRALREELAKLEVYK